METQAQQAADHFAAASSAFTRAAEAAARALEAFAAAWYRPIVDQAREFARANPTTFAPTVGGFVLFMAWRGCRLDVDRARALLTQAGMVGPNDELISVRRGG